VIISGVAMVYLADQVANFLEKNPFDRMAFNPSMKISNRNLFDFRQMRMKYKSKAI